MVRLNNDEADRFHLHLHDLLLNHYDLFRNEFLVLHPTDKAEFFSTLKQQERQIFYRTLTSEEMAEVFQGLDILDQKNMLIDLDQRYASEILNHLYADDAADFLAELDDTEALTLLKTMNLDDAKDVKELMAYPPKTAGAIMTKEFISLTSTHTAQEVIEQLRMEGPEAETIYYLYVVNQADQLVGVVSLRDLITAQSNELVENLMSQRVVSVDSSTNQEEVAQIIKKYDFLAAPVINSDGILVGIVTVDDIIDVLEDEATEDLGDFTAARGATDIHVSSFKAAQLRAPWIVLLMFFGLITAGVIDQFEETLSQIVLLAAFIPLLMGSAGNAGTQSLAVVVRGLALGTLEKKGLVRTLLREFQTGMMIGIICALALLLIIPIFYKSWILAIIVGISIFCSLSVATVIGAIVPLIINKLKLDPAFASGPFITTVNDILGLLIYFTIATSLLEFL
ncbi:magnesium transporter [Halalkalibacter akibai]|uniref:Magnesium transporter MgtE n=1 Tax=Halalkalibacter akibai (strain ATCC 43226 / DSM 21942 / CIP 109018 / JCM 9157 / 1139) TaxID=1236973 RepID=W4R029_HALA3|nr:magnesium transporter [Halalkalibacter akibai]GAE37273.1 magnesium transporter [Halalkalibacter akibai JCM 9157]